LDKSINEDAYLSLNEHPQLFVASDSFKNPYFPGILNSIEVLFSSISLNASSRLYHLAKINNGIQLQHDEELGELLKRYAFFDFYLICYFIKPYLEYLAFSFKNINNEISDTLLIEQINTLEERNQFLFEEIKTNEAMIAQCIAQKISKKRYQSLEDSIANFKSECEENNKQILKLKEQLKSSQ
jgi:hypothetical protein